MRYTAVLLASLLLAGCALLPAKEADFSCPRAGILADAATITFNAPKGGGADDVVVKAAMAGFTGECVFKEKSGSEVTLTLPFMAQKGAAGGEIKDVQLPYFIAVLSPDETVLQRQEFSTTIDFDNAGNGSAEEEHTIKIPKATKSDAHLYKLAFGFALTPEQLQYNKDKK